MDPFGNMRNPQNVLYKIDNIHGVSQKIGTQICELILSNL